MHEKVAIKYIIHRWSHGPVACLLTRPPLYGVKAPQHCRQLPIGPTLVTPIRALAHTSAATKINGSTVIKLAAVLIDGKLEKAPSGKPFHLVLDHILKMRPAYEKTITDVYNVQHCNLDGHDFDNESTVITITKMKPDYVIHVAAQNSLLHTIRTYTTKSCLRIKYKQHSHSRPGFIVLTLRLDTFFIRGAKTDGRLIT